jgi:hypothetical protein
MGGVLLRGIGRGRVPAVLAALGLVAAGCSSSGSSGSSSLSSFSSMFGSSASSASNASASGATPTAADFECPSVAIRQGASTLAIGANPGEESALSMRYQVGIGQTARECKLNGSTVTMRVGVQGRVVLGPAGGPGQIEVPLRFAVVHEGPAPKTIMTKLQRTAVIIPSDQPNVAFTLIEEDISFPMPAAGDIDSYVVYIGFDPLALRNPERKRPAPPPRRRTTG